MEDKQEKTCQCDPHEISYKCCACHFKEPQVMKPEEKNMNKEEWKKVKQIRLEVVEDDCLWSFHINCPRWLFNILSKL